jgi:FSR family fosmidomycin resistance protein-like MFS transporter
MKVGSVGLLTVAHASADISQGALPVLLPFFIAAHHLTYAAAAAIVFSVNLVSTVAQPVFGHIADRRSRPWLIPVSMLLIGSGVAFAGVVPSYRLGLAFVMVTGLGIALFHPEGAMLMNHLAGQKKATGMSLFGIGGQLGFAIGPLMATAALLALGLKGTLCLLVPPAVMALLVIVRLPEIRTGYKTGGKGRRALPQGRSGDLWPAFCCVGGALLCRSVIVYGLNTFLPLFWINVLHQTKAAGGAAVAVLFGAMVVGNFFGGRSADRFGYRAVTVAGFVLLAALLPLLLLGLSPSMLMVLLVPIGLVMAAPFGPMVVLGQTYLPSRVGFASGVTLGLAFSFGGLLTPLFGWIADLHGLRAAVSVLAALPMLCLAFALMLLSRRIHSPDRAFGDAGAPRPAVIGSGDSGDRP